MRALAGRLTRHNPCLSDRRIQGKLSGLGTPGGAIRQILNCRTAPRAGGRRPCGGSSLAAQASGIPACDFLHVGTVILRRVCWLFATEIHARTVHILALAKRRAERS
jgi:putative transposase